MDFTSVNYLAVLVAAGSFFVIGFIWYSPWLFANLWMKEAGLTPEKIRESNILKTFGFSFILSLIISFMLALFLGNESGLIQGSAYGVITGTGIVSASLGIIYLFEGKSFKLFLINAGYLVVTFTIAGAILGIWH